MAIVDVRIVGVKSVVANISAISRSLRGVPFEKSMGQAARLVMQAARQKSPVDTGKLKASIQSEVYRAGGGKVIGAIGSDLAYSPFLEYPCRPHWPPPGALTGWARRHGWNEFDIRMKISLQGTSTSAIPITGSKGFYYLHRALEENEDRVTALIGSFVAKTVHRYS